MDFWTYKNQRLKVIYIGIVVKVAQVQFKFTSQYVKWVTSNFMCFLNLNILIDQRLSAIFLFDNNQVFCNLSKCLTSFSKEFRESTSSIKKTMEPRERERTLVKWDVFRKKKFNLIVISILFFFLVFFSYNTAGPCYLLSLYV